MSEKEYSLLILGEIKKYAKENHLDFEVLKNELLKELAKEDKKEEEPLLSSIQISVPLTDYLFLKIFVASLKHEFKYDVIDEDLVEEFLNMKYFGDHNHYIYKIFPKDKDGRITLKNSWWYSNEGRLASAREIYPVKRIRKIFLNDKEAEHILSKELYFYDQVKPFVCEYTRFLESLSPKDQLLYAKQLNDLSFLILFIEELKMRGIKDFDYAVLSNMLFSIGANSKYDSISKNLFISDSELESALSLLEEWLIIKQNGSSLYDIIARYDVDLEGVSKNYQDESNTMKHFVSDYLKCAKTTSLMKKRKKVNKCI